MKNYDSIHFTHSFSMNMCKHTLQPESQELFTLVKVFFLYIYTPASVLE